MKHIHHTIGASFLTVTLIFASGLAQADQQGIVGKDVTPFLLDWFHTQTNNQSLEVNVILINTNAKLAGQIALAASK